MIHTSFLSTSSREPSCGAQDSLPWAVWVHSGISLNLLCFKLTLLLALDSVQRMIDLRFKPGCLLILKPKYGYGLSEPLFVQYIITSSPWCAKVSELFLLFFRQFSLGWTCKAWSELAMFDNTKQYLLLGPGWWRILYFNVALWGRGMLGVFVSGVWSGMWRYEFSDTLIASLWLWDHRKNRQMVIGFVEAFHAPTGQQILIIQYNPPRLSDQSEASSLSLSSTGGYASSLLRAYFNLSAVSFPWAWWMQENTYFMLNSAHVRNIHWWHQAFSSLRMGLH